MKTLLLVLMAVLCVNNAMADKKDFAAENKATVSNRHKSNLDKIPDAARKEILKDYKGYKVASLCKAALSEKKAVEFILGLVAEDDKSAIFVGLIKEESSFKAIELSKHKLDITDQYFEVEVQCLDPREAASLGAAISQSEGIEGGMKKLKTDIGCVRPTDDTTAVNCFYWNKKKKKFLSAGGWIT